jgi:hypothetical protein
MVLVQANQDMARLLVLLLEIVVEVWVEALLLENWLVVVLEILLLQVLLVLSKALPGMLLRRMARRERRKDILLVQLDVFGLV